jgi:hypothetical protein
MTHHRLAFLAERSMAESLPGSGQTGSDKSYALSGFMALPRAFLQQQSIETRAWQCQLYQWAWQRAQAVIAPSWLEKDVLAAWN